MLFLIQIYSGGAEAVSTKPLRKSVVLTAFLHFKKIPSEIYKDHLPNLDPRRHRIRLSDRHPYDVWTALSTVAEVVVFEICCQPLSL